MRRGPRLRPARALERADFQMRAVVEKIDFQMNEYAKVAEALANGFAELERRVAQAAAQTLQPLLEREVARRSSKNSPRTSAVWRARAASRY